MRRKGAKRTKWFQVSTFYKDKVLHANGRYLGILFKKNLRRLEVKDPTGDFVPGLQHYNVGEFSPTCTFL